MRSASTTRSATNRARAGLLVIACAQCRSSSPNQATGDGHEAAGATTSSNEHGDTVGPVDVAVDACKDAVVLDPSDFPEPGEDWRITTSDEAAPLVNAREVSGAVVFSGDAIEELPEFRCLETVGTIWIEKTRLRDLSAFAKLRSLTEHFRIVQNLELESLAGLNGLEKVGGMLVISHNERLVSYSGLSSLRGVGTFVADGNDSIFDLRDFPAIEAELINIGGPLRNIEGLAGTVSLAYNIDSYVLESLEGLPVEPKMRTISIGGGTYDSLEPLAALEECSRFAIRANETLESLDGLQNLQRIVDYDGTPGFLTISGNPKLRDISGLANITIIETAVEIDNNEALVDLTGLEAVTSARQVVVTANLILQNIDAVRFGALTSVDDYIRVTSNWALPECQGQALCDAYPEASCQVANNDTKSMEGC